MKNIFFAAGLFMSFLAIANEEKSQVAVCEPSLAALEAKLGRTLSDQSTAGFVQNIPARPRGSAKAVAPGADAPLASTQVCILTPLTPNVTQPLVFEDSRISGK